MGHKPEVMDEMVFRYGGKALGQNVQPIRAYRVCLLAMKCDGDETHRRIPEEGKPGILSMEERDAVADSGVDESRPSVREVDSVHLVLRRESQEILSGLLGVIQGDTHFLGICACYGVIRCRDDSESPLAV